MWGLHILVERNTSWRPSTVFQRHFCGCKAVKIPTALCIGLTPYLAPRNKSGSGRGLALAGRRLHHFMLKNLVESSPFLEIFWEILPRVFGPLTQKAEGQPSCSPFGNGLGFWMFSPGALPALPSRETGLRASWVCSTVSSRQARLRPGTMLPVGMAPVVSPATFMIKYPALKSLRLWT